MFLFRTRRTDTNSIAPLTSPKQSEQSYRHISLDIQLDGIFMERSPAFGCAETERNRGQNYDPGGGSSVLKPTSLSADPVHVVLRQISPFS